MYGDVQRDIIARHNQQISRLRDNHYWERVCGPPK